MEPSVRVDHVLRWRLRAQRNAALDRGGVERRQQGLLSSSELLVFAGDRASYRRLYRLLGPRDERRPVPCSTLRHAERLDGRAVQRPAGGDRRVSRARLLPALRQRWQPLAGGRRPVRRRQHGRLLGPAFTGAVLPAAIVLATALALGWFARVAALLLLVPWAALVLPEGFAVFLSFPVPVLLTYHASLPAAPYGSLAARGRTDPGGGWALPPIPFVALWIGWVAVALIALVGTLAFAGGALGVLHTSALLAFVLLAPYRRARPIVWTFALLPLLIAPFEAPEPFFIAWTSGFAVLHLHLFDPGWIPALGTEVDRVFYDGHCGLCHRSVRFLLVEDRVGSFRFAPLQGPTFAQLVPEAERATLPDTMVVVRPDRTRLLRGAAAVHLLSKRMR